MSLVCNKNGKPEAKVSLDNNKLCFNVKFEGASFAPNEHQT